MHQMLHKILNCVKVQVFYVLWFSTWPRAHADILWLSTAKKSTGGGGGGDIGVYLL